MRKLPSRTFRPGLSIWGVALLSYLAGCDGQESGAAGTAGDVVIDPAGMAEFWKETSAAVAAAPAGAMGGPGLVGVLGGARVKLLKAGRHEVWLPCPQADAAQVPVAYGITTVPMEAGREFRFREREGGNVGVVVKLEGKKGQELRIEWAATVLVGGRKVEMGREEDGVEFLKSSGCVQSGDERMRVLAEELWPEEGGFAELARAIQGHIRAMKQHRPPRSMDALGILDSGANWICTANANLAAALMRAKGVPARSLAVVPPTGQKLEMHRVVECFTGRNWVVFDPSMLTPAIPLQPWHGVVMARTTIADEEQSMKPRMGVSVGCPVGQELEFSGPGISFSPPDFFWTLAKPLKEYSGGGGRDREGEGGVGATPGEGEVGRGMSEPRRTRKWISESRGDVNGKGGRNLVSLP